MKVSHLLGYIFLILFSGALFVLVLFFALHPFSSKQVFYIAQQRKQGDGPAKYISLMAKCFTIKQNNSNNKDILANLENIYSDGNFFINNNEIANISINNLPNLFVKNDGKDSRELFLKIILPMVIRSNKAIEEDRNKILYLSYKLPRSALSEEDMANLKYLVEKYKIDTPTTNFWLILHAINELVVKVRPINNSLLMTMIIRESNWGEKPFVYQDNSLFNVGKHYLTLEASVMDFSIKLNSDNQYGGFRLKRFRLASSKYSEQYQTLQLLEQFAEDDAKQSSSHEEDSSYYSAFKEYKLYQYDSYKEVDKDTPLCIAFK